MGFLSYYKSLFIPLKQEENDLERLELCIFI